MTLSRPARWTIAIPTVIAVAGVTVLTTLELGLDRAAAALGIAIPVVSLLCVPVVKWARQMTALDVTDETPAPAGSKVPKVAQGHAIFVPQDPAAVRYRNWAGWAVTQRTTVRLLATLSPLIWGGVIAVVLVNFPEGLDDSHTYLAAVPGVLIFFSLVAALLIWLVAQFGRVLIVGHNGIIFRKRFRRYDFPWTELDGAEVLNIPRGFGLRRRSDAFLAVTSTERSPLGVLSSLKHLPEPRNYTIKVCEIRQIRVDASVMANAIKRFSPGGSFGKTSVPAPKARFR